jgi:hypothetical protein
MTEDKKNKANEILEKIKEIQKNKKFTRDGKVIIEKMERPEPWPEPPDDEKKK